MRCEDGAPAFVIAGLVTTSRVFPLAWPRPAATGAGLRSCAPAKLANPTKTPKRARAARPGCTRFLFSSCFALLSPAGRAAPSGAGARPFPVFILELTATSRVLGCGGCPAFLLLFTGSGLWTAHETRRWSRRLSLAATAQGPQAAARAIPVRAGTGRPHRRSRRVRSRRSPPPCGRRGRACGRRAPPGGYWASPSPRRGEARARSPIRRAAG